jgi:HEAT repeat protein
MDPETKELQANALEKVLAELVKSMRSSFMYPPGHPSLKKSYENAHRYFRDYLNSVGEFSITSAKEGIDYEEAPLNRDNEALKRLSQDLIQKNIFRLTFKNTIIPEEFESFVSLIAMDSRKFRSMGSAATLFSEHGIKGIAVKEMEYDSLLKDSAAGERGEVEKESPDLPPEADVHGAPPQADPQVLQSVPEFKEEEDVIQKEIDHYLSLLSKEVDPERFKKILLNLIRLCEDLTKEQKMDYVLTILMGLARETIISSRRPEAFAKMCVSAIRRCQTTHAVPLILDAYVSLDDKNREMVRRLLRIIGEESIEPALAKLIDSQDAQSRRGLINLLIGFGESARPKLEIYLFDDRWYVVRNMAVILGEIRSEKSLNSLSRAVNHKDFRVQREVIKALTRIGGPKVSSFLLRLLPTAPEQLSLIIINSLGVLGDASATKLLIEIALKKDIFHKNYELRKEAINALAKLKDPEAVETLGRILTKREFLGGIRYEDLQIGAARALGRIGGERSIEFLTRAASGRNRNIKRAATASLAALGAHS